MVWPFSSTATTSSNLEEQRPVEDAKKVTGAVDKPEDVAQSRSTRGRKITDGINENCALESLALLDCQDSWSLWNRFTLCQHFQSRYMDCINTQRTLLLQLGYGKPENTLEEDELIKWHADELYQKRKRDDSKTGKSEGTRDKTE